MSKKEKTKLEKEDENFRKHVSELMRAGKVPKHAKASVERSVMENHHCMNLKGYWVQMHPVRDEKGKVVNFMPSDDVLKELEMTQDEVFEILKDIK